MTDQHQPADAVEESRATEAPTWVRVALVIVLLYLFLVGVKALETGIKAFGSDFTEALFERVSNPMAGVFVGVLATVLVQSSSVTTSTIVGLVGAGSLSIELAVPMIMGANIGTTVTNTLVSLGYLRRTREFRLAFAGATMHDFFNICNVAVMLPLELTTGFLTKMSEWMAERLGDADAVGILAGNSPIKTAVGAPVKVFESAIERLGSDWSGALLLVVGVGLVFLALATITRNMRLLMTGRIERSLNTVLRRGGGLAAITIGTLMTVVVQSSSITTSVLVPMIAAGVVTVRNAFPITLGANIGTTITALLASLATESTAGLVIGLHHFLFNAVGVAFWYSIPFLRNIPIRLAERLADYAVVRKSIVIVYAVGLFVLLPLIGVIIAQ